MLISTLRIPERGGLLHGFAGQPAPELLGGGSDSVRWMAQDPRTRARREGHSKKSCLDWGLLENLNTSPPASPSLGFTPIRVETTLLLLTSRVQGLTWRR
ncbi:hypothetical protein VTO42DRAFT_2078 [Malbranchea cinnamomea]